MTTTKLPAHFSSLPAADELRRSHDEVNRATEKLAAERRERGYGSGFGSRIAQAIRRKTASAQSRTTVSTDGESFGQKIKQAVEKKSGKTQHEKQAEKDRARRHPLRRPHTKSD